MNIQKMLTDARKLGLPEKDITKITTLSETLNKSQTQLSNKPSKTYEPRDLLGQKAEDRTYRSKGDLLRDKDRTKKNIKSTEEAIKDAKEEKRKAFWIVSSKERRKAEKAAKKKIKDGKQQIDDYEHHILDIDATIEGINTKVKEEISKSETELQAIATSIQTQLATKRDLATLAKMMKKIDLNDKKFAPLIAFYNANAKLAPSLDNPLPEVPSEVKELMTQVRMETVEKTIRFTSAAITRYAGTTFRAASHFTKDYINAIRQSRNNQLALETPQRPLLTAGGEGR